MANITAGMLSAVQYVADHPRCTWKELTDHMTASDPLDDALGEIWQAMRAVLIQENGAHEPYNLTVTAKGLAAIGRA